MSDEHKASADELAQLASESQLGKTEFHKIGNISPPKNNFKTKLLSSLLGVMILAFVGLKFYIHYIKNEEKTVTKSIVDNNESRQHVRTDLGKNYDPVDEENSDSNNNTEKSATAHEADTDTSANRQGFQKYLSISTQPTQNTINNRSELLSEKNENQSAAKVKTVSNQNRQEQSAMKVSAITLDPDLYIEANTIIPCALSTRFVSDVAGKINCVITDDVWSANHHVKLIEKGTKAFGSYQSGRLNHGQGRMFVIWEQLRTPDFKRIDLANTSATGALGESGIAGWIDSHFWQRFGGALMLSTVQDVAAAAANNVGKKDRNTDYTENSRQALADMARVALENTINIPPTMYKNQGDIIAILVGDDMDFSGVYQLGINL
ncbi:VirB10/TraB/TrbI family type IV secretion system protein [Arsenophonus nasoniae]|uniref:VirB10/TraB/TrbI family type IV secretion system protein n=1 Tax=Arsenophonus nasoniae TaxID=638 RepID=A0ABY8NXA2_9GAMM|nr:VirB10/TraB/TrbI family type IV secretion system protein [Arsenophonus nasoniae]WGM09013.1 VirB10/TraB/TrbI family type IV secretion system protein [Arsenophonus nasoniae]